VRIRTGWMTVALLAGGLIAYGQSQPQQQDQTATPASQPAPQARRCRRGSKGGVRAARLAAVQATSQRRRQMAWAMFAAGTGKGAVDLVDAASDQCCWAVGTGAAKGGTSIVKGTAKGTGKIVKERGRRSSIFSRPRAGLIWVGLLATE